MPKMNNFKLNKMVFMNSWTIELYGAGIGDDFDAKMN